MFSKLSLVALLAPLVSAITLSVPQNPTTGGTVTITWTTQAGDPPTFSVELINTVFNNAFAIANNVDTSLGTLTLVLPSVPVGDGYTLQAVNIGDINDVFSTTASFSIGAATSVSSSPSTSGTGTASGTGTTTGTGSVTLTGTRSTISGTTVGTTRPTTAPATTATTPASTATAQVFGGGAAGLKTPMGGLAALVVSVLAGAAVAVAL